MVTGGRFSILYWGTPYEVIFHFSKRLKRRWVIYLQHKIKDKSIILITISRKTKKELTYVAASNYYITKVLVFDWLYVNIFDSQFFTKMWSFNIEKGNDRTCYKISVFERSYLSTTLTYNSHFNYIGHNFLKIPLFENPLKNPTS